MNVVIKNPLTKSEAIAAMREGKKVAHAYFGEGEWITIERNKIISEDGVYHLQFWDIRYQACWETDWHIVE